MYQEHEFLCSGCFEGFFRRTIEQNAIVFTCPKCGYGWRDTVYRTLDGRLYSLTKQYHPREGSTVLVEIEIPYEQGELSHNVETWVYRLTGRAVSFEEWLSQYNGLGRHFSVYV